jgi:hypothetical protein
MSKDTKHIRNRDAWKARALAYERAIRLTLLDNAHLTDGEGCELVELRRALRDNAPMVLADDVQADDKLHARPTVETMRRWIEQVQKDVTGAGARQEAATRRTMVMDCAQDDVDISGRSEGVKK